MLRILNGHSLDTKELLYPESMGLNLSERDSTASPTADRDEPQMQVGDWAQDMDEPGAGIVWRVRTVDTQYNTETITYTLEHLINSLADRILPDEVKAEDMGGSGGSCTAKQAAQYILGQQSDWVLGDFEFNVSNPYRFSGETLKAALETVTNSLEDPVWEYDFTVYPFRLHVRQLSDTVDSELREDRNLTTLKYTIDRTRMYTRFYPVGKNNLKPDGKYVSKNEAIYGRVDKTETDQSKDTEAKLIAWANERLERHAEPLVTVTISGLDLSAGTGEPLDKMTVCHKCRVPLPAYSTTIVEKVTKLSWRDKIKDKESVTVTLANALTDVQSIIKEEKSKSGGGRRTAAELNYEIETTIGSMERGLYTRITQTAYEIRMEAHEETRGLRSIISQTAESIRLMVWDDSRSLRSQIIQTAESIRLIVENTADSLRSQITQTAESIRLEVSNEAASLRSSITQTADSIRLEVANEASSIRSQIVQTAASIRAEVADESASIRSVITQTAASIRAEVADESASIRSVITQTAASIRAEVSDESASIRSVITQTASSIRSEVTDTAGSLRSEIAQERNRISLVVEGSGASASVKRAAIILAINGEGGSSAHIDADQVYIGNQKSTTVINGKAVLSDVTADYIATKIATLSSLTVSSIACTGTIGANELQVGTLKFRSSSGSGYSFSDLKDLFVTSVEVTGPVNNVYTLKYYTANNTTGTSGGTFSRAVSSFTGKWSGNHYQVTVSPQNQTGGDTYLFTSADDWTADHKKTVHVYYFSGSNPVDVLTPVIDAGSIYTAGDAASGAAAGRHGSGYSWDFTITRGDGTTKLVTIDCASIYSDARIGYTANSSITLFPGSWSGGIITVTATGGASASITLPQVDSTTWENTSGNTWRTRLAIGGVNRYSSPKDFQYLYDAGDSSGYSRGLGEGDAQGYARGLSVGDAQGYSRGFGEGKAAVHISGVARSADYASESQSTQSTITENKIYYYKVNARDNDNHVVDSYVFAVPVNVSTSSGGITGLTRFYGPNGEDTVKMYYQRDGSYNSAGTHQWYWK